jgi:hypothetical protein
MRERIDRSRPFRTRRDEAAKVAVQQPRGPMATISGVLSEPIRVADLPLPPDVAEEVEAICRTYSRRYRAVVRDDIKLRYLYAGHRVIVTTAYPPGLQIHAIDLETADEVNEVYRHLHAQGHRNVTSLYLIPWDDDVAIVTVNPQS